MFYRMLNAQLQKAIIAGELSPDELNQLHASLASKRTLEIVYLIVAALIFIFLIVAYPLGLYAEGFTGGAAAVIVIVGLIFLVALYFMWFGQIKRQFNAAVKKGYPEQYDNLKLPILPF